MRPRGNEAVWIGTRWRIKIQRDGKQRCFYSSTKGKRGKAEAENKADAWLREEVELKDAYFEELTASYLSHIRVANGTAHKSREEATIRLYLPWNGRKVSSLRILDYQEAIDRCVEGRKKPLSARTCSHIRSTINALYIHARKAGIKMVEPIGLTIPTGATKGKRRILQPEDVQKLMEADGCSVFRFILLTGLRPGEVCGLRKSDLVGNVLTINRARNAAGEITTGKNENARRTIILPEQALENLDWLSDKPLSEKQLYKVWRRTCEKLGIQYVSLYELRHTMISVVKDTLPLPMLKQVVGHSGSMDTLGTYGHEIDGEKQAAAAIINEAFQTLTGSKLGSDYRQTGTFEGRMSKGVWVQVPSTAPKKKG